MYYCIEITETDGIAKAIWGDNWTLNEAVTKLHDTLGYQMKNAACKKCTCIVIDDMGAVYRSETYTKPVEE